MSIDTKVKNTLKSLGDIEHLISYAQCGFDEPFHHDHPSPNKVILTKEDATTYVSKLYSQTNEPSEIIELFQTTANQDDGNDEFKSHM